MKKITTISIITFSLMLGVVSCGGSPSVTKYTVNFDSNGGTVDPTAMTVNAGATIDLPTPTKDDKNFLGWFTGWSDTDVEYTNTTKIEKDVTLIAKWNSYDVEFMNSETSLFKTTSVLPGQKVTTPKGEPGKPADESYCYNFDKWDYDFNTPINSDTKIYALYNKEAITYSTFEVDSFFNDHKYNLNFVYKDTLFNIPSTKFDRSLASFSLGLASCPTEKVDNYLSELHFDNVVHNSNFLQKIDGYTFAHTKINNEDIIAVINKGFEYGPNWADNLDAGLEGPHHGFYVQALNVYENLLNYLKTYQETPYKMLITGYSRAAAVSNLLVREMMINNKISKDNLYSYTFSTPKSIPQELIDVYDFSNVFNIINGADVVQLLLPSQYQNCTRIGVDIDIYRDDIGELIKKLDQDIDLGTFTPTDNYQTEPELAHYIINNLASYDSSDKTMKTREEYVENYQDMLVYLVRLFLSLKEETLNAIKADVEAKGIFTILSLIIAQDGLFNYVNPFIKEDGITYDEEQLKSYCAEAVTFITSGPGITIIPLYQLLTRVIAMHSLEACYSLFNVY